MAHQNHIPLRPAQAAQQPHDRGARARRLTRIIKLQRAIASGQYPHEAGFQIAVGRLLERVLRARPQPPRARLCRSG